MYGSSRCSCSAVDRVEADMRVFIFNVVAANVHCVTDTRTALIGSHSYGYISEATFIRVITSLEHVRVGWYLQKVRPHSSFVATDDILSTVWKTCASFSTLLFIYSELFDMLD